MGKIGLITLHGMGTLEEGPNYADDFFKAIRNKLTTSQNQSLETEAIYYQGELNVNEEVYFDKVRSKLDWRTMRKFFLYGIADAGSLESLKGGSDSAYAIAQGRILEGFLNLHDKLGANKPVIIVAQSLGGQVISNYLWDAGKSTTPPFGVWATPPNLTADQERFCRGKSVYNLYTTGCNIPIFLAGHDPSNIKAIKKPHPDFQWHNYYDKDDVLGWPLKLLSDSYRDSVDEDHQINVGNLIFNWNPFSHNNYWNGKRFLNPLATQIKKLIKL